MSDTSGGSTQRGATNEVEGGHHAETSGADKAGEPTGDRVADKERSARVQQDATVARSRAAAEAQGQGPGQPDDGVNQDG